MPGLRQYIPNLGQNSNVTVGSVELSPETVQYKQVVLTNAQVLAMNTTPVQIISAPVYTPLGTNLANVVTDFTLEIGAGTAYAGGGSTTFLTYGTATSQAITDQIGTSVFFSTGSSVTYAGTQSTYTVTPNGPVYLTNTTGNFTTGTGLVTVNVWYAVIAI